MGSMKQHLGNATLTISSSLWKSPRGTILRIEALVVLAFIATFFQVAIGSSRRWSNSWIIQKGFLAANAVSLSIGPYIIGIMQSASIRSEMYPIWAVSLYTLFGCVDPVISYNGLDYKGSLSKIVYQICFHCGYVLLMVISTMSSGIGQATIAMLSAITFIKGFHSSLALVQQKRMRNMVAKLYDNGEAELLTKSPRLAESDADQQRRELHIPFGVRNESDEVIYMDDIIEICKKQNMVPTCYDASIALYLSNKLHRRFLGINNTLLLSRSKDIDFMWAWKLIEIELGFLYDVFFSGSSFLHYYQAKSASIWTLASLVGICFVGVAAAISVTSSRRGAPGADPRTSVIVVDTNCADVVITFVILASVALLQLMQLIRCWTSNWARVALACMVAREQKRTGQQVKSLSWWMRLREFMVTRTNMFDLYLWQDKLGQYSLATEATRSDSHYGDYLSHKFARVLGLDYIWEVLFDLLGTDTKKGAAVRLDYDVKASIIHFLDQLNSDEHEKNHWSCFLADKTLNSVLNLEPVNEGFLGSLHYANWVMMWHVITCYCELSEQDKRAAAESAGESEEEREKNRRVAITLSKYCAYLVVSVPELLPGPATATKRQYNRFAKAARKQLVCGDGLSIFDEPSYACFKKGKGLVDLTKQLLGDDSSSSSGSSSDPWEVLVGVWVRLLAYGTVGGNGEKHMQHLSQGGEFITHLWAFIHHLNIRLSLDDLVRYVSRPLPGAVNNPNDEEDDEDIEEIIVEGPYEPECYQPEGEDQ